MSEETEIYLISWHHETSETMAKNVEKAPMAKNVKVIRRSENQQ